MDRQTLISQVKDEYAQLASRETMDTFQNSKDEILPEAYYEDLLEQVVEGIRQGKFDDFRSGLEIVEAVANNKSKWL